MDSKQLWFSSTRAIKVEELNSLSNVKDVQETAKTGQYRISTEKADEVKASLFRLAADKQWLLQELRQEEVSLQEVFRQLTGKKVVSE